jgi:hypothetical protein
MSVAIVSAFFNALSGAIFAIGRARFDHFFKSPADVSAALNHDIPIVLFGGTGAGRSHGHFGWRAALASLAGAGATGVVAFAFLLGLSLSLSGGYAHRPRHSSTHGKVASNKDGKVFSLRTFSQ